MDIFLLMPLVLVYTVNSISTISLVLEDNEEYN